MVKKDLQYVDSEPLQYETEFPWWIHGDEEGANPPKSWKKGQVLWGLTSPTYYFEIDTTPGLQLLYNVLNNHKKAHPERIYYPEPKLKRFMLRYKIPLFSLESNLTANSFDVLGFSIFHVPQALNVLPLLELMQIPYKREERVWGKHPLLLAGGATAMNPEPIAEIFDVICIGEGEDFVKWITDILVESKKNKWNRQQTLTEIAKLQGAYVPEFTQVDYSEAQTDSGHYKVKRIVSHPDQEEVKKVIVNLDQQPVSEFAPIMHSKTRGQGFVKTLEVARGCRSHCRFCIVGPLYSPYRERSWESVKEAIDMRFGEGLHRIGLSAPTPTDFSSITEAGNYLLEKGLRFTIQSERADTFNLDSAMANRMSGRRWITIALEAPDDRVRKVINKKLSPEKFLDAVEVGLTANLTRLKIMGMLEHPTETPAEALSGWEDKLNEVFALRDKINPGMSLLFSICPFRPKPHTPFQWEALREETAMFNAANTGIELARRTPEGSMKVRVQFAGGSQSRWLDVILSRGDRRLMKMLEFCFSKGWVAEFPWKTLPKEAMGILTAYLEHEGVPVHKYIKGYDLTDDLPWDFVNLGLKKEWILEERAKAYRAEETEHCHEKCTDCGACPAYPEVPHTRTIPFRLFELKHDTFTPRYEKDNRVPVYLKFHVMRDPELTNVQEYKRRLMRAMAEIGIEVNPRVMYLTSSLWSDALNWEGIAIYEVKAYVKDIEVLMKRDKKFFEKAIISRGLATELLSFNVSDTGSVNRLDHAQVYVHLQTTEADVEEFKKEKWIVERGGGLSLKKSRDPGDDRKKYLWDLRDDIVSLDYYQGGIKVILKKGGDMNEIVSRFLNKEQIQTMKIKPFVMGYD